MAWATLKYTRSQVDAAGRALVEQNLSLQEYIQALDVLANWRSAHSFPLNTFQMGLRQRAWSVSPSALVAQRLKRVPSMVDKLRRYPSMGLSRMQDIGGCRAVVGTVSLVEKLRSSYAQSRIRHTLHNQKDYIANPKASGYRSAHLVYKYHSDRSPTYDGLLIEVQLRSLLQHAWATAVETVGTFLGESLKSSEGSEEWLAFFALASSAFALEEGTPTVPGTPDTADELRRLIAEMARRLAVFETLQAYGAALQYTESKVPKHTRYFLLMLDLEQRALTLRTYRYDELDLATREYLATEKEQVLPGRAQAVLVSAESLKALRRAYPNYFLDTRVFVDRLRHFIER